MTYHRIEIDYLPDRPAILAKMGIEPASDEADDFLELMERLLPSVKAKAAVGRFPVDRVDVDRGTVVVGGVAFSSQLLAKNVQEVNEVWPYLATCGREIYDMVMAIPDPFERYWGEEIMQNALTAVRAEMERFLRDSIYNGKVAAMSPGSLPEWPISQQIPLFQVMAEPARFCGIELTDSLLMLPNKSVSGFLFPNEHGFVSCKLCPRDVCPNRRAAYDEQLAAMA